MDNDLIRETGAILITDLTTNDQVVIHLELKNHLGIKMGICIASIYLPLLNRKNKLIRGADIINDQLDKLIQYCSLNNKLLLMGFDSNSHAEMWNCKTENDRGKALSTFLLKNNLMTLNKGNVPTFHPCVDEKRSSIIDITVTNENLTNSIHDWTVNLDHQLSVTV